MIYIYGFIITWIFCRIIRGKNNNDWKDVGLTFCLSIFSWIGLLIIFICWIYWKCETYIKKTKPPKWL